MKNYIYSIILSGIILTGCNSGGSSPNVNSSIEKTPVAQMDSAFSAATSVLSTVAAYGNGAYVIINQGVVNSTYSSKPTGGQLDYSSDDINWQLVGDSNIYKSVIFAAGKFVAVGGSKDSNGNLLAPVIEYSTDGTNWQSAQGVTGSAVFTALTYAAGKFVAVAADSTSWYSSDGVNWQQGQGLSGQSNFTAVTYAAGKFVAVASGSTAWYSSDGINWQQGQGLSGQADFTAVTYAVGKFVAVASYSTAWYSSDGINWQQGQGLSGGAIFNAVTYAVGKFVAVASDSTIWYSSDGINWQQGQGLSGSSEFYSVIYANNKFVTVGYDGVSSWYSTDGINWQSAQSGLNNTNPLPLFAVFYTGSKFIATSTNNNLLYSLDGQNWTTNSNLAVISPTSNTSIGGYRLCVIGTSTCASILHAGQNLVSTAGTYQLVMQNDGNLVVYSAAGQVVWASGTSGSGNWLTVQTDGNLVVYSASNQALWASNTVNGGATSYLALGDDGNLGLYQANGTPVWTTGT